VQDVEPTVEPQKEHVVGCDVLYVSELIYHVELRQDAQGLEPHTERPKEINWVQWFVHDYGCQETCSIQIVVRKGVRLSIEAKRIRLLELHEVNRIAGERDEHDLHYKDVEGFPAQEEINIPRQEYDQEYLLCAVGQSCMCELLPMTFLLAVILSSSMSTAIRCRKSPMNWKMSIFYVLLYYKYSNLL